MKRQNFSSGPVYADFKPHELLKLCISINTNEKKYIFVLFLHVIHKNNFVVGEKGISV